MASIKRSSFASSALTLLVALWPAFVVADVPLNLCADFNTADMGRNISIYQTNGLCSDFCRADYAYAVTQEQSCWCSDYTPDESTQVDMDRCYINCPAYPPEKCGGRGLFGYVELNGHLPSGTKGGEDESPSSTTTEESSTETTEAPEPTRIETITTDGGSIRTVTVVPTISGSPDGSDGSPSDDGADDDGGGGKGLGTGGIVGIVVGVIGAVLIAAGLALFWFFRRRKQNKEQGYQDDPSVRGSSSDRMGSNGDMVAVAGTPGSAAHNSNRNSTLQIDPRMDPFKQGLYGRNGSHESINTLRDDHDYSRRILRATNPDPATET